MRATQRRAIHQRRTQLLCSVNAWAVGRSCLPLPSDQNLGRLQQATNLSIFLGPFRTWQCFGKAWLAMPEADRPLHLTRRSSFSPNMTSSNSSLSSSSGGIMPYLVSLSTLCSGLVSSPWPGASSTCSACKLSLELARDLKLNCCLKLILSLLLFLLHKSKN